MEAGAICGPFGRRSKGHNLALTINPFSLTHYYSFHLFHSLSAPFSFRRYAPLMQTVFRKFPVAGVQLIDDGYECNESSCRVDLNLLGVKSSGVYRCEVSGDAPHFKLTARSANMSVEGKFADASTPHGAYT